ncbi:hypothetical protein N657DRAFT_643611 [Parathielavia appendiculata]|uniref:C2 NT-type domain-containing protein n=1 Tax=Parathielavia appendiculata TaxID=2587402 RepID=A0AAN6Z4N5_9PEZI|nr:hypothetical protein N657DRAFT_643611 [Parathielavia appendiculata]
MRFLPIVNKARKPKFDVHLKISDLNNVPLVSGMSMIKWHLPHSIHGEHRGRTSKCPILNHRVEYNYSKVIPVRIGIDRNNNLVECPIEFEVVQEFSAGGRDEKITLGTIRLNLSEYVEESEAVLRHGSTVNSIKDALSSPVQKSGHHRKRSSLSNIVPAAAESSPRTSRDEDRPTSDIVQDGVVRRYLMQDSKINSTLKISILMVQVEGEHNYNAPPPKSAPVFGGIAGFVAGDAAFEPVDPGATGAGHVPSSFSGKSRDMFELQDMYRRALAASWASQPGELPADQCIEDIFAGGEGFAVPPSSSKAGHARGQLKHHTTAVASHGKKGAQVGPDDDTSPQQHHTRSRNLRREDSGGSVSDDEENNNGDMMGTLRPRDLARLRRHLHHLRDQSVASDRSTATVLGGDRDRDRDLDRESSRGIGISGSGSLLREPFPSFHQHRREESKITHDGGGLRSRSSSLVSLATTLGTGSERNRGREGLKRAREVDEFEVRDDLVAWTIPGTRL